MLDHFRLTTVIGWRVNDYLSCLCLDFVLSLNLLPFVRRASVLLKLSTSALDKHLDIFTKVLINPCPDYLIPLLGLFETTALKVGTPYFLGVWSCLCPYFAGPLFVRTLRLLPVCNLVYL